ncbi:MAG: YncE family protein, partial [Halobacteriaceae archaeon]
MRLLDPSGNNVVSFATDNPQWELIDGDGTNEIYTGNGQEIWTRVEFEFDWGAGTYVYTIDDGVTQKTGTRALASSISGVRKMVLGNYSAGAWVTADPMHMWFSDFAFRFALPNDRRLEFSETFSDGVLSPLTWTVHDDAFKLYDGFYGRDESFSDYVIGIEADTTTQSTVAEVEVIANLSFQKNKKKIDHHFMRLGKLLQTTYGGGTSTRIFDGTRSEAGTSGPRGDIAPAGVFLLSQVERETVDAGKAVDTAFPFVAYAGVNDESGEVVEIDLATFTVNTSRTVPVLQAARVWGLAVAPDGRFLYVAYQNGALHKLDRSTLQESAEGPFLADAGVGADNAHGCPLITDVHGRYLFWGDDAGKVYKVDADAMVESAKFGSSSGARVRALDLDAMNDYVYVGDIVGNLYKLKAD